MLAPLKIFNSLTIRTRLLLSFVAMAFLPALVITVVSVRGGLKGGQQQVINQLVSVATLKEANIKLWVDSLQFSLAKLEKSSLFASRVISVLNGADEAITRSALRSILQQEIEQRGLFDEIFIVNLKHQIILSTNGAREGQYLPVQQLPYFEKGLNAPINEVLAFSTLAKYNYVVATRPISNYNNQAIGILVGQTNLNTLNKIIAERAGLGETGETYLVGQNNFLLTELRFGKIPKAMTEGINQTVTSKSNITGLFDNYNGEAVFGVYHWLPNLGVVLVAEQAQAEAFKSTYELLRLNALVAILAALGAAGVGLIATRNIATPLMKLAETATFIAAGAINLEANVNRNDEIGVLGKAFNSMTKQLRQLIAGLEAQVSDLTRTEEALRVSEAKYRSLSQQLEVYANELEAKNKTLQRMDALKDEFLANTSHELRTPLSGIIGITESLLAGAAGPLTAAQAHNLALVISSGRRLASLIDDILDFSKLKHQALTLQIKPLRLHSFVEVVLTLSAPLMGSKALELINEVSHDLPPVYGDENRVQQILYNLVGNAIKFTEQGQVKISAQVISATQLKKLYPATTKPDSAPQNYVAVTVFDTGIGIATDKLQTIFQPFEQADGSIARLYGGTGLGLAVTKQLVELHGGEIWVDSTLGEGARFTFILLVSNEAVAETPLNIASTVNNLTLLTLPTFIQPEVNLDLAYLKPTEGEFHILVVDDEPINRQVLVNQLSLQHYQVTEAASGEEALRLIRETGPYDLLILDVMMPRMSGYEVCRELRLLYSPANLPVIMLTAKNQVADLVAGFEAGANDYLAKPFSSAELLVRIRTHLQINSLRALNASKDKFFAIVSHDLRGPFGPVLGMSELLGEMAENVSPDDIKVMSGTIHQAAKNVYDLLENLLEWSRLQRGSMPCQPVGCHLHGLVDHTWTLLNPTALAKGIELANVVSKDIFVYADENMLDTVIRNLTANALKFTPKGGQVSILAVIKELDSDILPEQMGYIPITTKSGGNKLRYAQISIIDTGVGISLEDLGKLFKINVHHSTQGTAAENGTGLGLIICQEMVAQNGGKIWVESTLGQGTTVNFTLPLDNMVQI